MNLPENSGLVAASEQNVEFHWLYHVYLGSIIRLSPMKYIERMEIEFATAQNGGRFQDLCDELWYDHQFLAENVRWSRSDEYLAVIGATFVRWKPVED